VSSPFPTHFILQARNIHPWNDHLSYLNLQSPWQGRRWLKLINEDPECGWRLKPDLELAPDYLGFSINSNRFGLRGPADQDATDVVFGTSYAMGIAVCNGQNWHELCLPSRGWLNLGIAVGFMEWGVLLDRYHKGKKNRAVLLYHPNVWQHCAMYERWRVSQVGLFEALHWHTDWWACARLALRKRLLRRLEMLRGRVIEIHYKGFPYEIDCRYAFMDPTRCKHLISKNLRQLASILSTFKAVDVVRLRVKQELALPLIDNEILKKTVENYDDLWMLTRDMLSQLKSVRCFEPDIFRLDHYHERDTHWNRLGNAAFAEWMKKTLLYS
jgi:hypothetical protein